MRTPLVLAFAVLGLSLTAACTGEGRSTAPPSSVGRAPAPEVPAPVPAVAPAPAPGPVSKMNDADDATRNANARPAAPAEPAYDLAADRERRARVAKEELGPKAITTVVSDIFVVIGPPGWQGGAFEQSVSLMRNSMAGYLNNRFGKKPSQAISVYLFPEGQTYESLLQEEVRRAVHRSLRLLPTR